MTDREKLIALMIEAKKAYTEDVLFSKFLADFLIANGVTFATDTNDGAKMEGVSMDKRRCDNCKYYNAMRKNGERCRCRKFSMWVMWHGVCKGHEWMWVWKE